MTREEAIEELTNALEYIEWSGDKSCVLSKETIKLAISALSENKEEWIPVSKRLPEYLGDVLVTDGVDIFVACYNTQYRGWDSYDDKYDEYTPILAWQPLPEPYKKGE